MQVSRNVVVGTAIVFAGLLAIVFFLLGRESNRRQPAQAVEVVRSAPVPELPPTATPPVAPPVAVPPAVVVPPVRDPLPAEKTGGELAGNPFDSRTDKPAEKTGAVNPTDSRTAKPDDATAVRDYFTKMDSIQVLFGTTDTSEFANKLLASAVGGDMSGFDSLIAQAESSAERAHAISPPAPCRAYHEKMLALLAQSTDMVKGLAGAIKGHDMSALNTIATSGNAMQTQLTALEADGKALKAKYGIH